MARYTEITIRRASSYYGTHIICWFLPLLWFYSCWRLRTVVPIFTSFGALLITVSITEIALTTTVVSREQISQDGLGGAYDFIWRIVGVITACTYISNARKEVGVSDPREAEKLWDE